MDESDIRVFKLFAVTIVAVFLLSVGGCWISQHYALEAGKAGLEPCPGCSPIFPRYRTP